MLRNLVKNIGKELFNRNTLFLFIGGFIAIFAYMMIFQKGFNTGLKLIEALGFALVLCLLFALTKAYMVFVDEYYDGFRKKK